uniref:Leucine-rich repeat-containing protein 3 n=1 Tax=Callorhinchus milii TaxID=7868 RepID=A0A4W3JNM8_CALMI
MPQAMSWERSLTATLVFWLLGVGGTLACPDGCSCSGENGERIVHCSHRNLKEIPKDIPWDTFVLDLDSNQITEVPDGAFKNLHRLVELYLSNNQIERVSATAFRDVAGGLKLLDLSNNNIRRLRPEAFSSMRAKTRLYSNPWHCTCDLQELISVLNPDLETVNDIICSTAIEEEYAGRSFIQLLNAGINFCNVQQKTMDVAMLVTMFCWFSLVISYVVYYVRQNQEDARRHLEYLKSLPNHHMMQGPRPNVQP